MVDEDLEIKCCPICGEEGEIWEGEDGSVVECGCQKCRLYSYYNYLDMVDEHYNAVVKQAILDWNSIVELLS